MRKQKELAAGIKRVRFFLATDDAEAEAEIKAAFQPGLSRLKLWNTLQSSSQPVIRQGSIDVSFG